MGWEPLPEDRTTMRPVNSSLDRLRRTLGLARADTMGTVEANWPQLVGAHLATRCAPRSLRGRTLLVAAPDPAVAEHLRWSATDLVAAVNAVCGGAVVESVEVRVGPVDLPVTGD